MDSPFWHLPFAATVAITASIGVLTTMKFLWEVSRQYQRKKDILFEILKHTAPVVAAQELAKEGRAHCVRRLGGRQLIITADPTIADYVFNGNNRGNFVQRPAQEDGLFNLGMLNRGLIWNNDSSCWRKIRGCFQKALGQTTLTRAVAIAKKECAWLLRHEAGRENRTQAPFSVNVLALTRKVTFRATLDVFFGLKSCEYGANRIDEDAFIGAIVSYFKAWEYFLFRSNKEQAGSELLTKRHVESVAALQSHVRHMLSVCRLHKATPSLDPKNKILFDHLCTECELLRDTQEEKEELLQQSVLEMLLAGTDTSSVTAYYALLGLAANPSLQTDIRHDLRGQDNKNSLLLDSLIQETLRFKPVGPIVLRQAVEADPSFPGSTTLQAGAAILVHLAEMNLRSDLWNDPNSFQPRRFLEKRSHIPKIFFPFGQGPKGCIGKHLGMREVEAILETFVLQYNMSTQQGTESLESLETHWDIANQPDNPPLIQLSPVCD